MVIFDDIINEWEAWDPRDKDVIATIRVQGKIESQTKDISATRSFSTSTQN